MSATNAFYSFNTPIVSPQIFDEIDIFIHKDPSGELELEVNGELFYFKTHLEALEKIQEEMEDIFGEE